jgi:predicted PurR-regulated permease PerM
MRKGVGWTLTSVVFLLSLWVLRSFLIPLTWAFVIALATWPLYRRFTARLPRPFAAHLAPLLFTAMVTLLVLGPFGFAFIAVAGQAQTLLREIAIADSQGLTPPEWLAWFPLTGPSMLNYWNETLGTPGGVTKWLHQANSTALLGWAGSLGQIIARQSMIISITVLALFFLYRGGEPLAGRIVQSIHEHLGERGDAYLRQITEKIRATMGGMIVVALIDGVLLGSAYALLHVSSAAAWGAITGLFAMIPFLAYFVVAAMSLFLFAKGAGAAAIGLLVWGVAVIFLADKVVRPALIGRTIKLGFVWLLLGGLGGIEAFGLLGLFLGPVILSLAGALLHESATTSRASV